MDSRRKAPMGVELVKRGIVKETDIENALEYQREHPERKIGDILYTLNVCNPSILIEAIADILGEKGILLTEGTIKVRLTDYFSKIKRLSKTRIVTSLKEKATYFLFFI